VDGTRGEDEFHAAQHLFLVAGVVQIDAVRFRRIRDETRILASATSDQGK
jgi:hypothetical protein